MADPAAYTRTKDELRDDREVAGGREDLYGEKEARWILLIGVDGGPGEIPGTKFIQSRGLPGEAIARVLRATLETIEATQGPLTPANRHFVVKGQDLPPI